MRFKAIGFLTLALLLACTGESHARTWYVTEDGMGDAPTIQAAMDSAAYGDTVLVGPGTYEGVGYEGVVVFADGVSLISEMGPQHTVLRSDWGDVVTIRNVTFARLEGFRIPGATPATWNEHVVNSLSSGSVPAPEIIICNNIIGPGNIDYCIHATYFDGEIWGNTLLGGGGFGLFMEQMCGGSFHNNISTGSHYGVFIHDSWTSVDCNDIWGNYEDFPQGIIPWDPPDNSGNFSEDPLFCDPDNGDYSLNSCSPCLPGNHPIGFDCGLIGAFGEGCSSTRIGGASTDTWGAVKALYR
ncbi:MAG: hypothetical protein KAW17_13160 [Candidatus Eisenbacteria sp.]|nr:hypothetical protein [Candidatus Eisenbacteria bacterium]